MVSGGQPGGGGGGEAPGTGVNIGTAACPLVALKYRMGLNASFSGPGGLCPHVREMGVFFSDVGASIKTGGGFMIQDNTCRSVTVHDDTLTLPFVQRPTPPLVFSCESYQKYLRVYQAMTLQRPRPIFTK